MYPMKGFYLNKLTSETNYVPRCPDCQQACLRPNVMIFCDNTLVYTELQAQKNRFQQFIHTSPKTLVAPITPALNLFVLEIGAGTVVPSIRCDGEEYGSRGVALVRVNPSPKECTTFVKCDPRESGSNYFPLQAYSNVALGALLQELNKC
jgi:NAD-dependent SIR2 family protein deacetylase